MHEDHGLCSDRERLTTVGPLTVPQNTQSTVFTVSGGMVKIIDVVGEVTTIMGGGAANTKLVANPTVGADVDLCATADINGDTVGTMYNVTGTLADALVATTSGAMKSQAAGIVVAPGTVDLANDQAAATGAAKWHCRWVPLEAGATVT